MKGRLVDLLGITYAIVMAWTLILLIIFSAEANVYTGPRLVLGNIFYLLIAIAGVLLLEFIYHKGKKVMDDFCGKHCRAIIFSTILCVFIRQCVASYSAFFYTGWDSGIVFSTALLELYDDPTVLEGFYTSYYSIYPNNLLIVWVYKELLRMGIVTASILHPFLLVVFQLLLACLTLYLVYKVAYDLSGSIPFSMACFFCSCSVFGLSPWYIIPYSDATGLLFPILLVRLYQIGMHMESRRAAGIWFLLGVVAAIGGHVKPQIYIVLIAIAMIAVYRTITCRKKANIRAALLSLFVMGVGMLGMGGVIDDVIIPSLRIETNREYNLGIPHYLMMGLNNDTDGVFSVDDVNFSLSYATRKERTEANLEVIKSRLHGYGFLGMMRHLSRKQMFNYGDGTFAWGKEGEFYGEEPEWAHTSMSDYFRSYIYPDGTRYDLFHSMAQTVWMFMLCMSIGCGMVRGVTGQCDDATMSVLLLSLLGLTLFGLSFEARARYLFTFSPLYVIAGISGYRIIRRNIRNLLADRRGVTRLV